MRKWDFATKVCLTSMLISLLAACTQEAQVIPITTEETTTTSSELSLPPGGSEENLKRFVDEALTVDYPDWPEDPDVLCGEGLTPNPVMVNDAVLMDDLVNRLNSIAPPAEAADSVHKPLVESARLWGDALDSINLSCQTGEAVARGLLRLEAVLQLGGSMLNFRIASDNFWRLAIANGLEAIVGPSPVP
jgi:hypothetical protein